MTREADDLIVLLSSIRGDFISDYLRSLDHELEGILFLQNMKKFVQVKHGSVNSMLRRERNTFWQYQRKLLVCQSDVVCYQFLLLTSSFDYLLTARTF